MSSSYFFEYVMEAVNSDSENESPEHLESGIKRKRKEESTDQIHCLEQKVKRLRLKLGKAEEKTEKKRLRLKEVKNKLKNCMPAKLRLWSLITGPRK